MSIHKRIQEIQEKSGLSQRMFSKRIGRADRWLNELLTKKSEVYVRDVLSIEKEFGISALYLIKGTKQNAISKKRTAV